VEQQLWCKDGAFRPADTGNGIFGDSSYNSQCDLSLPKAPAAISYKTIMTSDGLAPRVESGSVRSFAFEVVNGWTNYEMNDLWRWKEVTWKMIVKRVFDERSQREDQARCSEISLADHESVRCVLLTFSTIVARDRTFFVIGAINELGNGIPDADGGSMRTSTSTKRLFRLNANTLLSAATI
jgi:hypothetical protein